MHWVGNNDFGMPNSVDVARNNRVDISTLISACHSWSHAWHSLLPIRIIVMLGLFLIGNRLKTHTDDHGLLVDIIRRLVVFDACCETGWTIEKADEVSIDWLVWPKHAITELELAPLPPFLFQRVVRSSIHFDKWFAIRCKYLARELHLNW